MTHLIKFQIKTLTLLSPPNNLCFIYMKRAVSDTQHNNSTIIIIVNFVV